MSESAPTPSESFALSEKEITNLEQRAEGGDIAAMKRLAAHYASYVNDSKRAREWLMKAARAGDQNAREVTLGFLARSSNEEERRLGEQLRSEWEMRAR